MSLRTLALCYNRANRGKRTIEQGQSSDENHECPVSAIRQAADHQPNLLTVEPKSRSSTAFTFILKNVLPSSCCLIGS